MEIKLHKLKNILQPLIVVAIIMLLVYNDNFEVANKSEYFVLYNNLSHFSMMMFLQPFLLFYFYSSKYAPYIFLLFFELIHLVTLLQVLLEIISIALIKSKFFLVKYLTNKSFFFPTNKTSQISLKFLQTKHAILPFI